jgi:hypothetical protein
MSLAIAGGAVYLPVSVLHKRKVGICKKLDSRRSLPSNVLIGAGMKAEPLVRLTGSTEEVVYYGDG